MVLRSRRTLIDPPKAYGGPLSAVLLILLLAALPSCVADAGRRPVRESGTASEAPLRRKARVEYYLNAEASGLTETVVREVFVRWDAATHFDFVYKGRHRAGQRRDGKNTVSFLTRWPEDLPPGKTAFCRNWYDRAGTIVESDILFNMELARFTTLRTNSPQSYYIEGVLAHEIGHMIGIDHIEEEGCLMKAFSPLAESYFMGRIDGATLEGYRRLYGPPAAAGVVPGSSFRYTGGN